MLKHYLDDMGNDLNCNRLEANVFVYMNSPENPYNRRELKRSIATAIKFISPDNTFIPKHKLVYAITLLVKIFKVDRPTAKRFLKRMADRVLGNKILPNTGGGRPTVSGEYGDWTLYCFNPPLYHYRSAEPPLVQIHVKGIEEMLSKPKDLQAADVIEILGDWIHHPHDSQDVDHPRFMAISHKLADALFSGKDGDNDVTEFIRFISAATGAPMNAVGVVVTIMADNIDQHVKGQADFTHGEDGFVQYFISKAIARQIGRGFDTEVKNKFEEWYLGLLRHIMLFGTAKGDRTGTGTRSITFANYVHDLREGLPQIRSRFLKPENPGSEMCWMLTGSSNVKDLQALGVPFWDEFADESGELGPVYGYLWRHWPNGDGTETDQIKYIEDLLKNDPDSRRMVVNCWHPSFIPDSKVPPKENYKHGKQALTPCHFNWVVVTEEMTFSDRMDWLKTNLPEKHVLLYPVCNRGWTDRVEEKMNQWGVPTRFLDLSFSMRSNDTVLGLPANFNMYAHLAEMLARTNNMVARNLSFNGVGDVHMYFTHFEGVRKQLQYAEDNQYKVFGQTTRLHIKAIKGSITEYTPEDFVYHNYDRDLTGPAIRFPIPV